MAKAANHSEIINWLQSQTNKLLEISNNNKHVDSEVPVVPSTAVIIQSLFQNQPVIVEEKIKINNDRLSINDDSKSVSLQQVVDQNDNTLRLKEKIIQNDPIDIFEAIKLDNLACVQNLLKQKFSLQERDEYGNTPFLAAVMYGKLKIAQWFLENGASIREIDNNENHALIIAAWHGHVELINWLLTKNLSLSYKNKFGHTALLDAVQNNQLLVVKYLLENGASLVERENRWGHTPLLKAASEGHVEIMDYLISKGASLTERATNGDTALMLAAYNGRLDAVKFLLQKGASPLEAKLNGDNAIALARHNGKQEIADYLAEFAKTNQQQQNQNSKETIKNLENTATIAQLASNNNRPAANNNNKKDMKLTSEDKQVIKRFIKARIPKKVDLKNNEQYKRVDGKPLDMNEYIFHEALTWQDDAAACLVKTFNNVSTKYHYNCHTSSGVTTLFTFALDRKAYGIAYFLLEKGADVSEINNLSEYTRKNIPDFIKNYPLATNNTTSMNPPAKMKEKLNSAEKSKLKQYIKRHAKYVKNKLVKFNEIFLEAIKEKREDIIKIIFKTGYKSKPTALLSGYLDHAAGYYYHPGIFELLLKRITVYNYPDFKTIYGSAIFYNHMDIVQKLIESGYKPFTDNLSSALDRTNTAMLKVLLNTGLIPEESQFKTACEKGFVEGINLLLPYFDKNLIFQSDVMLDAACQSGNMHAVWALLNEGASVTKLSDKNFFKYNSAILSLLNEQQQLTSQQKNTLSVALQQAKNQEAQQLAQQQAQQQAAANNNRLGVVNYSHQPRAQHHHSNANANFKLANKMMKGIFHGVNDALETYNNGMQATDDYIDNINNDPSNAFSYTNDYINGINNNFNF